MARVNDLARKVLAQRRVEFKGPPGGMKANSKTGAKSKTDLSGPTAIPGKNLEGWDYRTPAEMRQDQRNFKKGTSAHMQDPRFSYISQSQNRSNERRRFKVPVTKENAGRDRTPGAGAR